VPLKIDQFSRLLCGLACCALACEKKLQSLSVQEPPRPNLDAAPSAEGALILLPESCGTVVFVDLAALRPLLTPEVMEQFAGSAATEERMALVSLGVDPARDFDSALLCRGAGSRPSGMLVSYTGRFQPGLGARLLTAANGGVTSRIGGALTLARGHLWTAIRDDRELVFASDLDLLRTYLERRGRTEGARAVQ
jgi:hypothetical protein